MCLLSRARQDVKRWQTPRRVHQNFINQISGSRSALKFQFDLRPQIRINLWNTDRILINTSGELAQHFHVPIEDAASDKSKSRESEGGKLPKRLRKFIALGKRSRKELKSGEKVCGGFVTEFFDEAMSRDGLIEARQHLRTMSPRSNHLLTAEKE